MLFQQKPRLLLMLLLLLGPCAERAAVAQPCLLCRTERCPDKVGISDWCGSGPDPLALPRRKAIVNPSTSATIESEPAGAQVHLDNPNGELLGVTPLRGLALKDPSRRYFLVRSGFLTQELRIDARRTGQVYRLVLQLEPQAQPPIPADPGQQGIPPTVTAPLGPSTTLVPRAPSATLPRPLSVRRKWLAGLGGATALGALSVAVTLTVLTHDPTRRVVTGPEVPCPSQEYMCFYNFTPGYAAAYGLVGVSALTMILSLVVPARPG